MVYLIQNYLKVYTMKSKLGIICFILTMLSGLNKSYSQDFAVGGESGFSLLLPMELISLSHLELI